MESSLVIGRRIMSVAPVPFKARATTHGREPVP
jgi:hypothetical protein